MFIFMALLLLYSFLQSFNDCKDLFEDFFFGSMVSYDGVGGVPVEGDSFLIEVVDFLGAVFEERAFFYFYVAGNIFGVAVKEEDVAIFLEVFYAGTSFDDAASGGYDEVFLFGKVTDGSFFGIAEGVFGNGEEGGDGSSFFFFEVIVGIDEGVPSLSAMALPKVVLPLPGMPIRMMFLIGLPSFLSLFLLRRVLPGAASFLRRFPWRRIQGCRGRAIFLRRGRPA